MIILSYEKPKNINEAYRLLTEENGTVIGGGTWLKLSKKKITLGIDLIDLGLDQIEMSNDIIRIGSMATLREVETNPIIMTYMHGGLSNTLKQIMGVQLRNVATIGGSVAGNYGFSDVITPLLAIGAQLEMVGQGTVSLESFLQQKPKEKDILKAILLPLEDGVVYSELYKKVSNDFSVLNVSCAKVNNTYRIAVGARPQVAKVAIEASKLLSESEGIDDELLQEAALRAKGELTFGSNLLSAATYREDLCETLVKRCMKVVVL